MHKQTVDTTLKSLNISKYTGDESQVILLALITNKTSVILIMPIRK